MSFRTSLLALPPRTRLAVGLGFLAWGTAGLYLTDGAERKLGWSAAGREGEEEGVALPRVRVVERGEK
ncbi:uncharacterized protein L3040_001744 [Drepanopeziza brunnea f. sp. 'multigermtubi']|uniref:uncharacterized protein n=1 Tax=Drepanopeziza brunnea f. sp. 'multigermtubi' TaxID=698441 RepID=UPI00239F1D5E|nr:hypothetical protein L3040_001744 [Drepanopeziza brunnea f. sp. 'multigermtubi']